MKTRAISALVLIILLVPLLIIGKIPFTILMSILACLGLYELLKISDEKNIPVGIKNISFLFVLGFTIISYFLKQKNLFALDYRVLSVLMIVFFVPLVFNKNINKYKFMDAIKIFGIVLFLIISFTNFIYIRSVGLYYMVYLLIITITTDTFAYITGRALGKHKLAPLVSPNKTIEGTIGGSLVGTILSSIFYILLIGNVNPILIVVISLVLTIVGQIGDLVFSAIKRNYNVKDFSNLIPGHGGILDRFDSLIFVSLAFTLIIMFI